MEPRCVRLQFFSGQQARYSGARVCADPTAAGTVGVQCCHDPGTQLGAGPVCPEAYPYYQRNDGQVIGCIGCIGCIVLILLFYSWAR